MVELPPYTCAPHTSEPPGPWLILDDNGDYLNAILATRCNAEYLCIAYVVYNMYPGNTNITCRMREDHPLYEGPDNEPEPEPEPETPIDPEPEDPPVDPEPEQPVQSDN